MRLTGHNHDHDAQEETISALSSVTDFTPPDDEYTIAVDSTSVNDDQAGTGALSYRLVGLDSAGTEIEETVLSRGTLDRDTVDQFLAINWMEVLTAGSGGQNAGTVECRSQSGSNERIQAIAPGYNRSMSAFYTVPAGWTLYLTEFGFFGASTNSEIKIMTYDPSVALWMVVQSCTSSSTGANAFQVPMYSTIRVPSMHSVKVNSVQGGSNQNTDCVLSGILTRNPAY